jgi:hypothetical protein
MTDLAKTAIVTLPGAVMAWRPFGGLVDSKTTWLLEFGELSLVFQLTMDGDKPLNLERWHGTAFNISSLKSVEAVEGLISSQLEQICATWAAMKPATDHIKRPVYHDIDPDGQECGRFHNRVGCYCTIFVDPPEEGGPPQAVVNLDDWHRKFTRKNGSMP